jgi:aconitate hydratase
MPRTGEIDYSAQLELDLASVVPSVAGPGRPRTASPCRPSEPLRQLLAAPAGEGGYGKPITATRRPCRRHPPPTATC